MKRGKTGIHGVFLIQAGGSRKRQTDGALHRRTRIGSWHRAGVVFSFTFWHMPQPFRGRGKVPLTLWELVLGVQKWIQCSWGFERRNYTPTTLTIGSLTPDTPALPISPLQMRLPRPTVEYHRECYLAVAPLSYALGLETNRHFHTAYVPILRENRGLRLG